MERIRRFLFRDLDLVITGDVFVKIALLRVGDWFVPIGDLSSALCYMPVTLPWNRLCIEEGNDRIF